MQVERQVLFWLAALIALLLAVAVLRDVLLPFVMGIAIAYFLNPLVEGLTRLGLSRGVASALTVAFGAMLAIAALIVLVPALSSELRGLAETLPADLERLRAVVEGWSREALGPAFPGLDASLTKAAQSLSDNWAALAGWAAGSLWSGGRAIFNFLSLALITPLVVFYVLVDWHPMMARIDGWLPRDHRDQIRALAGEMNDSIAAFVRGQGTVCLVLGLFYAVGLTAIGLDYGMLIGLATGVLGFVPFVGWALGLIVATALAAAKFWPDVMPLTMTIGLFMAGMALDAALLSPKIVGSKIGLHPVWLIFALFVFSYLFGFIGTLIAVPLAAALAVLVRFGLKLYLESDVYRGTGKPEKVKGA